VSYRTLKQSGVLLEGNFQKEGSLHRVAACVSYRTLKRSGVLLEGNFQKEGSLHRVAACVNYRTLKQSGVLLEGNFQKEGSLHRIAACVSYRTLKRSGVLLEGNFQNDALAAESRISHRRHPCRVSVSSPLRQSPTDKRNPRPNRGTTSHALNNPVFVGQWEPV